ncbi:homocysteine-responsive endoplasmic reticulum-resident ubiquitin-like domain member 2 protein isoform X2 [Dinothrombium tinctorium]|uniref:Homocysteine-responsive endoplasmic reticulum-resident ubiquitin-like domain member 2 protein isoform X2 n=1 Tax=Dinothrombium tinctorium TaxID=1965070 RepID=A0A3S3NHJ0_9ACAR|nr:homocysteine-responsive endoplasmic reticulum-resident ubiquitin-like domain member 2 protein isoform X2 [Dinothrombium tinctorium]RWS02836.1 homocysteine-responsive endoplasmic reticulum-resident ubiquitin-like domain member 2 protein isoform X2 [Dinothrombium tinctorium]RWS02838.1 homocysteine-responsive endoplasmic reticulum-resident ubiquitin-like domain member 2 protein isoform X2 [Dinothrombium tinctorium]
MENNEIKLIVKAPNQKFDDQTVNCNLDWSVLQLKEHLSKVYPLKPRVEDQRLIYSGHMLKNEQTLRNILEPKIDDITFTVHLVCSQKHDVSKSSSNSSTTTTTTTVGNEDQHQRDEETQNLFNSNVSALGMQWNNMTAMQTAFAPYMPTVNPEQMMQQMAMMQQMYIQYMAQYFNQTGTNLPENMPILNPATNQTPPMTGETVQADTNTAQRIPPEAQQQQVQRMDAAPAGVAVDDDEDARNRDWLDWFYWFSRSIVFISILYFYSSFSRFVLVIGFGLLMYLYQNGFFNFNNNNNNQNERRQTNNNAANDNRDAQRVQEIMDGNINDHRRPSSAANVPANAERPTEERFTGLRLIWVIVSSLFSSLIPEQPAPVNLN